MQFSFSIPITHPNSSLEIRLETGQILFLLGANGTGKSSLLQMFSNSSNGKYRRISAHRQNWFYSGAPEFTGKQRLEYEGSISHYDQRLDSRWKDDHSSIRTQIAIFDLVNSENIRAREIAKAVDSKNDSEVHRLSAKSGVFEILNKVLRLANIDIVLSLEANDEIMAVHKNCRPYSISKLSDGERNAILIAANVLTVEPGTLLLIDEPERHLHRSIVSPLLSTLLKERSDCAFVVSTHEPSLPVDNNGSKVILCRGCTYEERGVSNFDIDLINSIDEIDDNLKKTILGERRKIVFVEGTETSLDKPLYSLLFPNASIVAKDSCKDVENAVIGIKGTNELHWVKPFGLVDNDSSEPERINALLDKGIIPINAYSVESIYYHPDIQEMVGKQHVKVVGGDIDEKLKNAKEKSLTAIRNSKQRICSKIAEKSARSQVFSLLPKKGEIQNGVVREAKIDFGECLRGEETHIEELLNKSDFIGILKRYPIRETPALNIIAKELGFTDRFQYESAVRTLLMSDPDAVGKVQSLLGTLPNDLIN